jgi:hypothetical protein
MDSKPKNISPKVLAAAAQQALSNIRSDLKNLWEFWEWRATDEDTDAATSSDWTLVETVLAPDDSYTQSDIAEATAANHLRTSRLSWEDDEDKQLLQSLTRD